MIVSLVGFAFVILAAAPPVIEQTERAEKIVHTTDATGSAADALEGLLVKGRAPKTDYSRSQFGSGWATTSGCDTRNIILYRDLREYILDDTCRVMSGILDDPYTGTVIPFTRGESDIQIDHVVALSDS